MVIGQTPLAFEQFPLVGQQVAQAQAPAMDARLHGPDWGLDRERDLVVVHPVDVTQHDRGPLVLGQEAQRSVQARYSSERADSATGLTASSSGMSGSPSSGFGNAVVGRRWARRRMSYDALAVIRRSHDRTRRPGTSPGGRRHG